MTLVGLPFVHCFLNHPQLPVVMRVPRISSWAQNMCGMQFSILGYGDIIVPGQIKPHIYLIMGKGILYPQCSNVLCALWSGRSTGGLLQQV